MMKVCTTIAVAFASLASTVTMSCAQTAGSAPVASATIAATVVAKPPAPKCNAPWNVARLDRPLQRTARKLARSERITIVALGSSSTEGIGASDPSKTYPRRLAAELEDLFPGQEFNVLNRGVSGETSVEMLARFDRDVTVEKPDLVIWQVGSNSVLKDRPLAGQKSLLHKGVMQIRAMGSDVILLDPQYVPKMLAKPNTDAMVDLIGAEAKEAGVDLFQRFALMKQWREVQGLPFETFVSSDMLHMNDWGYACLGKTLAMTIGEAVTRPVLSATARPAPRR